MNKDIYFAYDENMGWSRCEIWYNDRVFEGGAKCHPDDTDFQSERTGCTIAEARAYIKVLCFKRDHELKPQLKILQHLYSNMRTSKYYNPKSYEAGMLRSQIRVIENDLATINQDIADERKYLKEYIQKKDAFYRKLRVKHQ